MDLKGRNVRKYVENYYKHHKHKKSPSYIAGAVAHDIDVLRTKKKRTIKKRILRKSKKTRKHRFF